MLCLLLLFFSVRWRRTATTSVLTISQHGMLRVVANSKDSLPLSPRLPVHLTVQRLHRSYADVIRPRCDLAALEQGVVLRNQRRENVLVSQKDHLEQPVVALAPLHHLLPRSVRFDVEHQHRATLIGNIELLQRPLDISDDHTDLLLKKRSAQRRWGVLQVDRLVDEGTRGLFGVLLPPLVKAEGHLGVHPHGEVIAEDSVEDLLLDRAVHLGRLGHELLLRRRRRPPLTALFASVVPPPAATVGRVRKEPLHHHDRLPPHHLRIPTRGRHGRRGDALPKHPRHPLLRLVVQPRQRHHDAPPPIDRSGLGLLYPLQ
mmetsp:Transcript_44555/g.135786  ORF Transcript_44555/g.135786 Transcript_44555/m.135786 type:complete len:316 (+) Transcript_44555:108-1055(+)